MSSLYLWLLFVIVSCAVCHDCSEQDGIDYISLLTTHVPRDRTKYQLQLLIKKASELSQTCTGSLFGGLIKKRSCENALRYSVDSFVKQKSSSFIDNYYVIYARVLQKIFTVCSENDLPTVNSVQPSSFYEEADNFMQINGNPIACVLAVAPLEPLFKRLIEDVKAHASFNTISADLTSIFSKIDGVCSACNIPQPKTPLGPIDVQACLIDGVNIAGYAENIVKAQGDKEQIIRGITNILAIAPKALQDCGIPIPSH